jgi:hypothetical protein
VVTTYAIWGQGQVRLGCWHLRTTDLTPWPPLLKSEGEAALPSPSKRG